MSLVKVYAVTFMRYTNGLRDTVYNTKTNQYLDVIEDNNYSGSFLIKENDLDHYKDYGDGFESVKFIGYMEDTK